MELTNAHIPGNQDSNNSERVSAAYLVKHEPLKHKHATSVATWGIEIQSPLSSCVHGEVYLWTTE